MRTLVFHKPLGRTIQFVILFVGFLIFAKPCYPEDEAAADTDFLSLAAMMIKDGHFSRALSALQQINLDDEELDRIRFFTLKGLAELNLERHQAAEKSLLKAIEAGQTEPVIHVYLAQAHFALKEYKNTINSINKAGRAADAYPALYEMKAQCHWLLERKDDAWLTLNTAQNKFPGDYRFLRRQVFYLVELGVYHQAALLGKQYLVASNATVEDYIAVGNALRLSHQLDDAIDILERARLQFPTNNTVAKVLSHSYIDRGMLNAAAAILENAAYRDAKLISEAAELYRRANRLYKSLELNTRVTDQKAKLKQRVAILLGLKRHEQVSNMESTLYRVGLLDDQNIRYAIAYANFATGQYQKAEAHLDKIKDPELFAKAVELRRVIGKCTEQKWKCA